VLAFGVVRVGMGVETVRHVGAKGLVLPHVLSPFGALRFVNGLVASQARNATS
jgi:hypothetical protein